MPTDKKKKVNSKRKGADGERELLTYARNRGLM